MSTVIQHLQAQITACVSARLARDRIVDEQNRARDRREQELQYVPDRIPGGPHEWDSKAQFKEFSIGAKIGIILGKDLELSALAGPVDVLLRSGSERLFWKASWNLVESLSTLGISEHSHRAYIQWLHQFQTQSDPSVVWQQLVALDDIIRSVQRVAGFAFDDVRMIAFE
ncbi:hypothetical protein HDU93_005156 [Gonapodya sp. JEL0774]|nr:hypothetical protein HDU93_005156 [Gonapodya sp. JEL0774]